MAEQKEIDAAIKESLDLFFQDDDPGKYAQPIQSAEDLFGKGLLNPDGTATSKGVLFTTLQDAGAVDANGALTEKGKVYSLPPAEIRKPENWQAFKRQWDDGVIRPEASWDDTLAATGKFFGDAALGTGARVLQEVKSLGYQSTTWGGFFGQTDNRPQSLKDEMTATGLGLLEGATENMAQWAGMADVGSAWIGKKLYDVLPDGMEDAAEEALYQARQRQWALQQDAKALEAGEVAEHVLGLDGAITESARAKEALGAEAFNQQYEQAAAASQILADPTNLLPAAAAVKAATAAPLASRAMLRAQQIVGRTAAMDAAIAGMQTVIETGATVLKKEAATVGLARKLADDFAARGIADPVLIEKSTRAAAAASRIADTAAQVRASLPGLATELEQAIAQRASLATRLPEEIAQKTIQTMELGRKMTSMPPAAIGAVLERVGHGLDTTDTAITGFLKSKGLDKVYTVAVGAAGALGLAGDPVSGAVALGAGALKTGKLIENYGKLFRYVGKEMTQARGQIPFWQRVAAHTAPGSLNRGLAHTFGVFELGGATSDIIRRTGRGVAAAAPVDLAFEWLGDGADMRKQTLYQAAAESLVIGGSFAAAGGAFMGTKARMRELSLHDEINFRQALVNPKQKAFFEAIPNQSRRAIATYSVANPTLNFNFTDKGSSHYDPPTNTATINITSTNPLKALLGHEVLHHTVIKNNMEGGIAAMFLGDTKGDGKGNFVTGGLLRSKDGALDPNFGEFVEAYNRRMDNAGKTRPKLEELAVEYFIEQHSDQYSDRAESGALGAQAARGAARRWIGGVLDTLLPRAPVLKDLHFKMGGMMDGTGAMVTGNGLLGFGGIQQLPASNRMFRDMSRRSAGRAPGQFEPLGADSKNSGPTITLDPTNSIDLGLLHPLIVHDANDNPVLQNGQPVFIDKATDTLRANAGTTVLERLRENKAAGKKYAPGEMHLDDSGDVQGNWLSPEVLRSVISQNKYNREQAQILRSVNEAIKTGDGNRMVLINFAALKTLKNGKKVYATQAAALRDTVPVGLTITKDGNLLIGLMSVTKLNENITKRAQDKRGKRLYSGNTDAILTDVRAMMDYHKKGEDSIGHFNAKYGAVEADERKKFINTMFGLLNKHEQAVKNPLLLADNVKSGDNVFRTYRVDRVSKAVPMAPDQHQPMPFSYPAASAVLMPDWVPEPKN